MLSFFRNHQKWFFLFITAIIVISFSFFGSMQQMRESYTEDPVAFSTVNRQTIHRSEVEQMANFLSTDSRDKMIFGGAPEVNFFNDGVIQQDFLETGLAPLIVSRYREFLEPEMGAKQSREKKFKLYHHPKAEFISVESVWSVLAPDMNEYYSEVKENNDPLSKESVAARSKLYLGTRAFPDFAMKQALFRKMQQNSWVQPDQNLAYADVAPFGYRTVEEWFGPKFIRLVAGLIIDYAELAEKSGIEVSNEEAYASLIKQAYKSYQETRVFGKDVYTTPEQYLNGYLRSIRSDMSRMVSLWRKVLLFRRYFDVYGGAALVDNLPFSGFATKGQEFVSGVKYTLPPAMNIESAHDLNLFETYLQAVTVPGKEFPRAYLSADEVAKTTPELVYKEYEVTLTKATSADLIAKIPVKEMWKWQVQNWKALQEKFPIDLKGSSKTDAEKFAILDKLDAKSRKAIDKYSREQMATATPESMAPVLAEMKGREAVLRIPQKGGKSPFTGVQNLDAIRTGLAKGEDFTYSEDGKTFYRFSSIKQNGPLQVWTLGDAKREGILDSLAKTRAGQMEQVMTELQNQLPGGISLAQDEIARSRFKPLLEKVKKSDHLQEWVVAPAGTPLENQFKLTATPFKVTRFDTKAVVDPALAFDVKQGEASQLESAPSGEASFFVVTEKGTLDSSQLVLQGAESAGRLIGDEANRSLFEKTLADGDVIPQYMKTNE